MNMRARAYLQDHFPTILPAFERQVFGHSSCGICGTETSYGTQCLHCMDHKVQGDLTATNLVPVVSEGASSASCLTCNALMPGNLSGGVCNSCLDQFTDAGLFVARCMWCNTEIPKGHNICRGCMENYASVNALVVASPHAPVVPAETVPLVVPHPVTPWQIAFWSDVSHQVLIKEMFHKILGKSAVSVERGPRVGIPIQHAAFFEGKHDIPLSSGKWSWTVRVLRRRETQYLFAGGFSDIVNHYGLLEGDVIVVEVDRWDRLHVRFERAGKLIVVEVN